MELTTPIMAALPPSAGPVAGPAPILAALASPFAAQLASMLAPASPVAASPVTASPVTTKLAAKATAPDPGEGSQEPRSLVPGRPDVAANTMALASGASNRAPQPLAGAAASVADPMASLLAPTGPDPAPVPLSHEAADQPAFPTLALAGQSGTRPIGPAGESRPRTAARSRESGEGREDEPAAASHRALPMENTTLLGLDAAPMIAPPAIAPPVIASPATGSIGGGRPAAVPLVQDPVGPRPATATAGAKALPALSPALLGGEAAPAPAPVEAPVFASAAALPPVRELAAPPGNPVAAPSGSAATRQVVPAMLSVVAGPGGAAVTLHLNPGELGSIRITLERDAEGAHDITLAVERPETMQLLRDDVAHLHAALDLAGVAQTGRTVSLHMQMAEPPPPAATASMPDPSGAGANPTPDHRGGSGSGQGARAFPGANRTTNDPDMPTIPLPRRGWFRAGIDITA